jgi:hypothetical protein
MQARDLNGKWTYRSFRNNPTPTDGDPEKLARLLFAEAEFTFDVIGDTALQGVIDWGSGGLDLRGVIRPDAGGSLILEMVGLGRPSSPEHPSQTDGWQYDYNACGAHQWPNGIDQVPALVGSVIRVKPHNGQPAGYVASFIAVRKGNS